MYNNNKTSMERQRHSFLARLASLRQFTKIDRESAPIVFIHSIAYTPSVSVRRWS